MKVFICDNGWKGAYIVKAGSKDEAIEKIAKFLHSDITGEKTDSISNSIYEMIPDVIETKGDM